MNGPALTPPLSLGPFQDAVINEALAEIADAVESAIGAVAARRSVDPDDLRIWIAADAALRAERK